MKIRKFNESLEINYNDAFNMYIKDKKIIDSYFVAPYGDYSVDPTERFYGSGLTVEGNYKILYHGGGCSGEDCNTVFIVSPDNKLVAKENW